MRVFVTGATGFIGSAVVQELLGAGHEVVGLARSAAAAQKLLVAGAEVLRGTIEDRDCLRWGAERAEGVIHLAFPHDVPTGPAAATIERAAVRSLGAALAGSNCPLLVTSAIAALQPVGLASENDRPQTRHSHPHVTSEQAADSVAAWGVRVAVVRLPPLVYGAGAGGLVPALIQLARSTDIVAQPARGYHYWAAVHQFDAARLYRLALEQSLAPGTRLHAVAEGGVPLRQVTAFARADMRATSWLTRQQVPWQPQQAGLIHSIDHSG